MFNRATIILIYNILLINFSVFSMNSVKNPLVNSNENTLLLSSNTDYIDSSDESDDTVSELKLDAYSSGGDELSEVISTMIEGEINSKDLRFDNYSKEKTFGDLVCAVNDENPFENVSKIIYENPLLLFEIGNEGKNIYDYIRIAETADYYKTKNLSVILFVCFESQCDYFIKNKQNTKIFSKKKRKYWKKVLKEERRFLKDGGFKQYLRKGISVWNDRKFKSIMNKTKKL